MRLLFLATCLTALAACGGGSSSSSVDGERETAADAMPADLAVADTARPDNATGTGSDSNVDKTPGDTAAVSCDSMPGAWTMAGTCGSATCTVTQTGCTVSFSCLNGLISFSGSLSGNTLSYTHPTMGACTGTLSGTSVSGSCAGATTCKFTGTKQ